jgi:hypothetical protein
MLPKMSSRLGACVFALWLCASCDAGGPRVGSPGLEPPSGTDGSALPPGAGTTASGGSGTGGGAAGNGAAGAAAGSAGSSGSGTTGGGSFPLAGAGGATATAGSAPEPVDMGDAGLGADSGDPTFSTQHRAELMKDCQQSVACYMQRGEQLEPDPVAACLEDSAALLDAADAERQATFLATVERCAAFVVCDYYDCATSPP